MGLLATLLGMSSDPSDSVDLRLAWRDELLCAMVPHAVHRLGNLLTVVMGSADLLAMDESNAQRALELGQISTQTRRAVSLIQALGSHARTQAAPAVAVDLVDSLRALVELMSPVAKSVGMPLELGESAGMTVARVDPGGLQLLLVGLLNESLRPDLGLVGREGSVVLRVVETGRLVQIQLRFEVTDGVPLEPFQVSPAAEQLAGQLGVRLRTRGLAARTGLVILAGLAVLS